MHQFQDWQTAGEDQGGEMTNYERQKNAYDRNVYYSTEEKEERFRKMLEAEERRRLKEEYMAEIRRKYK